MAFAQGQTFSTSSTDAFSILTVLMINALVLNQQLETTEITMDLDLSWTFTW